MKNIFYASAAAAGSCLAIACLVACLSSIAPQDARAETRISGGILEQGAVWVAADGPYILEESVTVPAGALLIIGQGTVVSGDPASEDKPRINVSGSLSIQGTQKEQVNISDLQMIDISRGHAEIDYANITLDDGIFFERGSGRISSSTISGAWSAIHALSSDVSITGSRFEHNQQGIFVESPAPVFQVRGDDQLWGVGGLGNAAQTASSSVSVSGSAFVDNSEEGIRNAAADSVVHAERNWWGSPSGPATSTANGIFGNVLYAPWLMEDPTLVQASSAVCCSSILFLPGFEGTRLYSRGHRLWEPLSNKDAARLYLNKSGSSTDATIYSGDPIDEALGIVGVYGKFMDFLDSLVDTHMVNEWRSFGYDWRKPVAEVVAGAERKAATTESLPDVVEQLAANSKTGKVTIVAHSNGGLVAKYLVKLLAEKGKSELIDSVISAAVPFAGTPQAIGSLLHGDGQSLGYGLIMNKSTARTLGTNAPGAYTLLPSQAYFSLGLGPTIAFASTTVAELNDGSYPLEINSSAEQDAFIADAERDRPTPAVGDISRAGKGNAALLRAAEAFHGLLDPFSWPAHIAHWAIVGWGKATAASYTYSEKRTCRIPFAAASCTTVPVHEAVSTSMGDGTVVAPSASYDQEGASAMLDLVSAEDDENENFDHVNILESHAAQEFIERALRASSTAFELPASMSWGNPNDGEEAPFLVLGTHSPVELHVYDSAGRHTGMIPTLPELAGNDFISGMYEEKIPGSSFMLSGADDDPETYIFLPDRAGQTYSVEIDGIGVGQFTYTVERRRGAEVRESVTYADLPVTPLMKATSTVSGRSDKTGQTVSGASLASSTPPLQIDIDGDGASDMSALPDSAPDDALSLEMLKKAAAGVLGRDARFAALARRIDRIKDLLRRGKKPQLGKLPPLRILPIMMRIRGDRHPGRAISAAQRREIADMIERFISQYE